MYNEALKTEFIRSYTQKISTAKLANVVFNATEPYEVGWDADLCTKDASELQPVIDHIASLRSQSKYHKLIILKDYVKWCIGKQVPGVCDGMLKVNTEGLDKIRLQTVASPFHLQSYLDILCEPEQLQTTDNMYRCIFWLAYAGIPESEILNIREKDIDFTTLTINYGGLEYPMYRESLQAFKNCVTLKEFAHKHPNYGRIIYMDRVSGDKIIRGVRQSPTIQTLRVELSRRAKKAVDNKQTNMRLSYYRAWLSGLFYRMYERERAGFPVDFTDAALQFTKDKEYKLDSGRNKPESKVRRVAKDYTVDYQRWKLAFLL